MPLPSPTASGNYRIPGQTPSGRGFDPSLYGKPGPVPGVNAPAIVKQGAFQSPTGLGWGSAAALRPYIGPAGGMVNLFNQWNAQGVPPPAGNQNAFDIAQWYQNGMWGGETPFYLLSKGWSMPDVKNIIFNKPTANDRAMRDAASMVPNMTMSAYGSPMQSAGMMPYGNPSIGVASGTRPTMNQIKPQNAFTLPSFPMGVTKGFSTPTDPWGLGP